MVDFVALDIESSPRDMSVGKDQAYALEPFSCDVRSIITSVSIYDGKSSTTITDISQMPDVLKSLEGKMVWTANGVFDVSYLMQKFGKQAVKNIKWMDVQIGTKLLYNGDAYRDQHFSLVECCKLTLPNWEHLEDFVAMKAKGFDAGENADYWLERGDLDAIATWLVAEQIIARLPKSQIKLFKYMCGSIVPLSAGYLQGIKVDHTVVDQLDKQNKALMKQYLSELGVSASVIASPKQLGSLLFNEWGLPPISYSEKTGMPSTSADDIKMIAYRTNDSRMQTLLKYKTLDTIQSKYVKGFRKAQTYLGKDTIHGSPRIFATATGRMSYSSSFLKKYQTSVALHQIPSRKKEAKLVKRALVAPEGYGFIVFDVKSQEMAIMAIQSQDPNLLSIFKEKKDPHSLLAADIFGVSYEDIVENNLNGNNAALDKYRRSAKRVNLSSMFRIGAQSLSEKFFTMDDELISKEVSASYLRTYKRTFEGIPNFWTDSILLARKQGFTETLGGLRYYTNADSWSGESASINVRIQGSAAVMSYFTICKVADRYDDFILQAQVHDSLWYLVKIDNHEDLVAKAKEFDHYMNHIIDYKEIFDIDLPIGLGVDTKYGYNYLELEAVK